MVPRASADDGDKAEAPKKRKWSVTRFAKQVLFFQSGPTGRILRAVTFPVRLVKRVFARGPDSKDGVTTLFDKTGGGGEGESETVIMVAGATGGVGKRCVTFLLSRGERVRCLVRDVKKAREMLAGAEAVAAPGSRLEIVAADITQSKTLLPHYFSRVGSVICATACKVAPKEGDTADRAKYYQGIKFFDPEIVGDTPEQVDFLGVKHVTDAFKAHGALSASTSGAGADLLPSLQWGALDDVVMGGVSESAMTTSDEGCVFEGKVRTENNGGFCSARTKNIDPPLDLSAASGLVLRVKGNGLRYKFLLRTDTAFDSIAYTTSFVTKEGGEWEDVVLPFDSFVPVFRAKTVTGEEAAPINLSNIVSAQIMLSKFEYDGDLNPDFKAGAFALPLASIRPLSAIATEDAPKGPTFVYISSAGVTRPNRPGIDVETEPPAVKLNEALGGILTYKLRGEDYVRESGVPFCIVRPCALTEEPEGAPIIVDQGDTIKGKISRDDVASLACAAILDKMAEARDVTFEIKSTQPFSEPFVQPEGFVARRGEDWRQIMAEAEVRMGVDGKTVDGVYTGNGKVEEEEEVAELRWVGETAAPALVEAETERSPQDAWYSW